MKNYGWNVIATVLQVGEEEISCGISLGTVPS